MAYFQDTSSSPRARTPAASASSPAFSGALAYLIFALAFAFTGAFVLGLVP